MEKIGLLFSLSTKQNYKSRNFHLPSFLSWSSDSILGKKVNKDVDDALKKNFDTVLEIVEKWFSPEAKDVLKTHGAYEYVRSQ